VAKAPSAVHDLRLALLVRPCGLAGSKVEMAMASACAGALGAVLLVEIVTPNDVVASTTFLPLVAAMWTLSRRLAQVVALEAALVFALILVSEVGNRPTVAVIGAVGLVIAVVVRIYATTLARLLATPRNGADDVLGDRWPALDQQLSSGVDALTRREVEVATLASRGYTAAEIGAQLHISERTVESHLANAYTKLAIHSRSGLRHISRFSH
jgi:DNA-binding CsgD family transcriptional regulator